MCLWYQQVEHPYFLLAGPNVIESEEPVFQMAKHIKTIASKYDFFLYILIPLFPITLIDVFPPDFHLSRPKSYIQVFPRNQGFLTLFFVTLSLHLKVHKGMKLNIIIIRKGMKLNWLKYI